MKRWPIILFMTLGITFLPSSLHAPEAFGVVSTQPPAQPTTDTPVSTVATVNTIEQLKLYLPFKVESRWNSSLDEPSTSGVGDTENQPGIWWNTNQGDRYFAIKDGQFIPQSLEDTWFVYGWFGPLSAIKEDYNIKYPQWQDRHNGIDFAGREGLEIVSASDGIVIFTGYKIGHTAIVKTGDYQITYGHLQDIGVRTGQSIKAGDLIGWLGKTGTTNPHLHFQVDQIKDGTRVAINPVPLMHFNWSAATIPNAPSNLFYTGPTDPKSQPNFAW